MMHNNRPYWTKRMMWKQVPEGDWLALIEKFSVPDSASILYDPFCGPATEADEWCERHGNTIYLSDKTTEFANRARSVSGNYTTGPMFQIRTSRKFAQVMLLNPPKKREKEDISELEYLRHAHQRALVQEGGYIILAVHRDQVNKNYFNSLVRFNSEIHVWEGEYTGEESFVYIVSKVGRPSRPQEEWSQELIDQFREGFALDVYDPQWNGMYEVPAPEQDERDLVFHGITITHDEYVNAVSNFGAEAGGGLKNFLSYERQTTKLRTVVNTAVGHMLSLMQDGFLDSAFIETPYGLAVIRSIVEYGSKEIRDMNPDGTVKRVGNKWMMIGKINLLYEDGTVVELNKKNIAEFMKDNRDQLIEVMNRRVEPVFDIDWPEDHPVRARWKPSIDSALIAGKYRFLPAQELAATAALHFLFDHDNMGLNLILEQGFGKSGVTSVTIKAVMDKVRAGEIKLKGKVWTISCPGTLMDKWERELLGMMPDANILKLSLFDSDGVRYDMFKEAAAFLRKAKASPYGTINIVVLSQDSAKLTEETYPVGIWSVAKQQYLCPTTGVEVGPPMDRNKDIKEFATGAFLDTSFRQAASAEKRIRTNGGYVSVMTEPVRGYKVFDSRNYPLQAERRSINLPSKGNGRVVAEPYAHEGTAVRQPVMRRVRPAKIHKFTGDWAYSYWPRGRYTEVRINDIPVTMTQIPGVSHYIVENLTGEEIPDAWLAMKGVRAESNPRDEIWRLFKRFKDLFIAMFIDEIHNMANAQTKRFAAISKIAWLHPKRIGLTGTQSKGKASSLFATESIIWGHELFKLFPWGEHGETMWKREMGILEEWEGLDEDALLNGVIQGNGRRYGQPDEREGHSIRLTSWLLTHSIYMDKSMMSNNLVPYREYPVEVFMAPDQAAKYKRLIEVTDHEIVPAMTQYTALKQYTTVPWDYMDIWGWSSLTDARTGRVMDRVHVWAGEVEPATDRILPKEQALIDYVAAHLDKGEGVAVYIENSQKRDIQPRLKSLIENSVPAANVRILTSKVKQAEREKWIEKAYAEGVNVLITRPDLVKEGLDLLGSPAIWWHELTMSLIVQLQASQRALRLPQTKPCTVYFPFTSGTIEEAIATVMARKTRAWMELRGSEFSLAGFDDDDEDDLDVMAEIFTAFKEGKKDDIHALFAEINEKNAQLYGKGEVDSVVIAPVAVDTPTEVPEILPSLDEEIKVIVKGEDDRKKQWKKDMKDYGRYAGGQNGLIFTVDRTKTVVWRKEDGVYIRESLDKGVVLARVEYSGNNKPQPNKLVQLSLL